MPDKTCSGCYLCHKICLHFGLSSVWPDLAIYWTLGTSLKHLATINLPKSPTFLGNFVKVSKSIIFLLKLFLGNFCRHLVIFLVTLIGSNKSLGLIPPHGAKECWLSWIRPLNYTKLYLHNKDVIFGTISLELGKWEWYEQCTMTKMST